MHIVSKHNSPNIALLRSAALILLLALPSFSASALQVFACEPEWAALSQVLAPNASVYSATTAHQDPHHIEARPSLVAKLRRADLLVCAGAELEQGWLPLLLRQAGNPRVQADQPGYLMAAEQVERLEILDKVDRSMGDVHAAGNPHVQMDPRRLLQVAAVLTQRLKTLDADDQEAYQQRYEQFATHWNAAIQTWQQQAAALRGQYYLSYHANYSYLADWIGLKRLATLEPKPGVPPSAKHLQSLRMQLSEQPVLAVLHTPAQHSKNLDRFTESMRRPLIRLPLSPELSAKSDEAESLLTQWFEKQIAALIGALATMPKAVAGGENHD